MAVSKLMRNTLKMLSFPEPDVSKSYKLERAVKETLKGRPILAPVYKMWDKTVISAGREVPVRVYTPIEFNNSSKAVLFFHGGGWVTESVDTYNDVCTNLANTSKCRVISVEYSLAPENPFPNGLEDCYAAAKAVILSPSVLGLKTDEIILTGDSAGGNLAAAVSLMARDRGEFAVSRQILLYPALYNNHTESSPYKSVVENGTDYLLKSKRVSEYMSLYASCEEDKQNPYFAPLLAEDLSKQPDTLVITAEFDPLRDEGEDYGRKLKEAGNKAEIYRMKDALHGFIALSTVIPQVSRAFEIIAEYIGKND